MISTVCAKLNLPPAVLSVAKHIYDRFIESKYFNWEDYRGPCAAIVAMAARLRGVPVLNSEIIHLTGAPESTMNYVMRNWYTAAARMAAPREFGHLASMADVDTDPPVIQTDQYGLFDTQAVYDTHGPDDDYLHRLQGLVNPYAVSVPWKRLKLSEMTFE
eukprot:TRINITY_DN6917_c0_g1_i2.p1 TRINITY_DN6917_c0_g1~~TRINITY_DN6917_c0_g1_i2.p1  ORF type:complete len:160 (+),score=18.81 TRINITY_DN6917_c0_g1_i2:386-865(+)